jgi:hypothetical protein
MWTLELTYGEKSGSVSLPDWPTAREKVLAALEKFVPDKNTRQMCVTRVHESDVETVGFFVICGQQRVGDQAWKIACQAALGSGWLPKRDNTTVVGE